MEENLELNTPERKELKGAVIKSTSVTNTNLVNISNFYFPTIC